MSRSLTTFNCKYILVHPITVQSPSYLFRKYLAVRNTFIFLQCKKISLQSNFWRRWDLLRRATWAKCCSYLIFDIPTELLYSLDVKRCLSIPIFLTIWYSQTVKALFWSTPSWQKVVHLMLSMSMRGLPLSYASVQCIKQIEINAITVSLSDAILLPIQSHHLE